MIGKFWDVHLARLEFLWISGIQIIALYIRWFKKGLRQVTRKKKIITRVQNQ